jgi:hypothetical protein
MNTRGGMTFRDIDVRIGGGSLDAVLGKLAFRGPFAVMVSSKCSMSGKTTLRDRLNQATLEKLYVGAQLTTTVIAERFGTRASNIRRLMDDYGMPRRTQRIGKV